MNRLKLFDFPGRGISSIVSIVIILAIIIVIVLGTYLATGSITSSNLTSSASSTSNSSSSSSRNPSPLLYPIVFVASGLKKGLSWSVNLSGVVRSSNISFISFFEPLGSYPYNISSPDGLVANASSGTVRVNGQNPIQIVATTRLFNAVPANSTSPYLASVAFDPSNGLVYVADTDVNTLFMLNGSGIAGNYTIDTFFMNEEFKIYPSIFELAYNPSNGLMYATMANSSSIYVFNGTLLAGLIPLGNSSAQGSISQQDRYQLGEIAYDSSNGLMYVSVFGPVIFLINGFKVVGTINTGIPSSSGLVYDPINGYIYMTDYSGGFQTPNAVTAIYGSKVMGNVDLDNSTQGSGMSMAYKPNTPGGGSIYVEVPELNEVQVIQNMSLVGSIPNVPGPWKLAFDPADGFIFSADGYSPVFNQSPPDSVSVINGTQVIDGIPVGPSQPNGAAFDSSNSYMYVSGGNSGLIILISSGITISVNLS